MELNCMRTWAQISLSALEHNYRALRASVGENCRFLGIVKTDAYGHGVLRIAQKLEQLGCDMLAVACLEEALNLRRGGISAPILILGVTPPEFVRQVVEHDITQTVFTPDDAAALSRAAGELGKAARAHIKLDTGMSRMGILAHDAVQAAKDVAALYALPHIEWEGIYTHFAAAAEDEEYTMLQFTRFLDALEQLEKNHGITFRIRHCASSAAALKYPCTHLDMVRPGIALYGHYPDPSCVGLDGPGLEPVMSLYTRVAAVRDLPAGTPVSYSCTHVVQRDTRIAVLPIGYGDGLLRQLSDCLCVEIGGKRAPILGRICMDLCMADVTDLPPVQAGDVAVVFNAENPLEDVAELAQTIPYELLCSVSMRVPRIYVD